jgi:chromate reductase
MSASTITVLCGSLRENSVNRIIAHALPGLAPAGVSVVQAPSIGEIPLYTQEMTATPAAVIALADALRAADGIVIVTPEYNYSVPGVLKNAIDWISRLPEQPLSGKPLAIQSASPGVIGGARCQYHLRQILVFLNAMVLNKPEVMIGSYGSKIDAQAGTLTDPGTRDHIAQQLAALVAMIEQLKPKS